MKRPCQAGGFIIKFYFRISNIAACISYGFTVKQWKSNYISLCQFHEFLIIFSMKISQPWILNWISLESLKTIKKVCVLYFFIKTRKKSTSSDNGKIKVKRKEMPNLAFLWLPHYSMWLPHYNVPPKCEFRKDWYWAFKRKKWWILITRGCKINLGDVAGVEYISKNVIMAVLRKANSHSVDICRLIKNQ